MQDLKKIQHELAEFFSSRREEINFDNIKPSLRLTHERVSEVYKEDYLERLISALINTYNITYEIFGDQINTLAYDYVRATPSTEYNLNNYGENFTQFLQKENILIKEMLRAENAFNKVFHEKNYCSQNLLDITSVSDIESFIFTINPNYMIVQSPVAIFHMWDQRKLPQDNNTAESIIFYKNNNGTCYAQCNESNIHILDKLSQAHNLSESIDILSSQTELCPKSISNTFSFLSSEQFFLSK